MGALSRVPGGGLRAPAQPPRRGRRAALAAGRCLRSNISLERATSQKKSHANLEGELRFFALSAARECTDSPIRRNLYGQAQSRERFRCGQASTSLAATRYTDDCPSRKYGSEPIEHGGTV